jgi:hypothetical protein
MGDGNQRQREATRTNAWQRERLTCDDSQFRWSSSQPTLIRKQSKGRGRAGLTSPRNSVKECTTAQGFLTLQERRSGARTLERNKPGRSDAKIPFVALTSSLG